MKRDSKWVLEDCISHEKLQHHSLKRVVVGELFGKGPFADPPFREKERKKKEKKKKKRGGGGGRIEKRKIQQRQQEKEGEGG